MEIACLDLEGVLVPEIWIDFAERTGIEALKATTRDIPDYDVLMSQRLQILKDNGLKLQDIQAVIADITPLEGAAEFIDWLNREEDKIWSELGRVCIEFFETIPRAVFLPDGLMIAHGGVPHEDCQEKGLSWEMLNEDSDCLQAFVWGRVHEK